MRTVAVARALGVIVVMLASGAALGETAAPQLTPPEHDDPTRVMREAEKYQNVCRDLRTGGPATLDPSLQKRFFREAISGFCAYGEFILSGGTFKAAENAAGTCTARETLDNDQLSFIRNLGNVRSQPFSQIRLECVTVSRRALQIFDVDGGYLMLRGIVVDQVLLRRVNVAGGFTIQSSNLRRGLGLVNVTSGGPLQIYNSELGANPNWKAAFATIQVSLESVALQNATLHGAFLANYLMVKSNLALTAKTRIKGAIGLDYSTIGGSLIVTDSTIEGTLWLTMASINSINANQATFERSLVAQHARIDKIVRLRNKTSIGGSLELQGTTIGSALVMNAATFRGVVRLDYLGTDRIQISNNTIFEDKVFFDHSVINKELLIESETKFIKQAVFSHAKVHHLHITKATFTESVFMRQAVIETELRVEDNSTFKQSLYAENLRANALMFQNSTVKNDLNVSNADIGYLRTPNAKIGSLKAANARMRTMLITGADSVIDSLECGDCHIEQFALLAGRFTRGVAFVGAEIKGTLAFREGDSHVVWGDDAWLNLSEARIDIIVANACDFVLAKTECKGRPTMANKFVPTVLTGARYRTILPGRGEIAELPQAKEGSLLDVRDTQLLTKFITSANAAYNPQPYEQLANALSVAGKNNEAIDVRIARIDAMLADPNARPNVLMRIVWYAYYYISHYGFRNLYAFLWFLGLLTVGSVVKLLSRRGAVQHLFKERQFGMLFGLWLNNCWFALDRAVPPLHLDPEAEDRYLQADKRLPRLLRHYFYFHRVAGMVLISFFAAGLAGLGH